MSLTQMTRRARLYAHEAKSRVRRFRSLFGLAQGRSRQTTGDYSVCVPFHYADNGDRQTTLRVAAICHIFYPDLAETIFAALQSLAFRSDIFITTDTLEKADHIRTVFESWVAGTVTISVLENRGRDIFPKLHTLQKIIDNYDIFLFLHSKKTLYTGIKGEDWQRHLFRCLVGSKATTISILDAFERHPGLGLVFPQHQAWIRRYLRWEYSFDQARDLGRRMGFALDRRLLIDFPAGSMFWARGSAMRPLVDLGLTVDDFAPELDQRTGTLAHTVERLFCYVAEASGHHWLKVSDLNHIDKPRTVVEIQSPKDLDDFVRYRSVSLLNRYNLPR